MFQFDKKKAINYVVLVILAAGLFGGGFLLGSHGVLFAAAQPNGVDFSLFWDAYNKLHQNYINPSDINDQKVVYGAIDGMTKSLGDPFTDFFNPTQAKEFNSQLAGSFEGIGAEVGIKKDQLTIIAPLKDSPAQKAGIKAGDFIIKIDGKSTTDMTTDDAVNLIRGKGGTKVVLTMFREGWPQVKDITIVRGTIKIPSISWELKDGDVAYIQMYQFDQTLAADFDKDAKEILASPAKKIVLDLRGDPGGYLQVCQQVAGWFLKPGQVVTVEDFGKGKDQQKYLTEGNGALANYPMVILIDKGSASAAEILSGALRDNRGVQLIGDQSFGKGSVQQVIDLQDGQSFMKITIAHWLTPKGTSISGVGLKPDVKVAPGDNDVAGTQNDVQLAKALEIIRGLK